MDVFEFMVVLVSIILGLAMTEVFGGVARILRGDLDAYWVHSLWIIQVLIGQVQSWWSLWSFRGVSDWNFAGLLFLLAPPTFYFLAAALLFPKSTEPGDLRAYYFQRSRPFFLVLACLTALYLAASWLTAGFDAGRVASRVAGILLLGTLAFVRSPTIHAILSITGLIALAFFIGSSGIRVGHFRSISGLERGKHGGKDLEPEVLLVA